jgi:hypothetical protein
LIQRTGHTFAALIQYMRIDHRRTDVRVPQQLLQGLNIITPFQQMRRKRMSKGVRCRGLLTR